VRVDVDPARLNAAGVTLEDVRTAIASSSAIRPKGVIEDKATSWLLYTRTPGLAAADYRDLVVAWRRRGAAPA
jgi:multidrug efflux pump